MKRRLELLLQVLLILAACLLGIVTNYATDGDEEPPLLSALRRSAGPALIVLILMMIAVQVLVYRLQAPARAPRAWEPGRSPYPGLDAFTEQESAVFFGREDHIAQLTQRLHSAASAPGERFVTVAGSSGSGKSSLVRAGVLPRLRERRWRILPIVTPGGNPLAALAQSLAEASGASDPTRLARRLRQAPHAFAEELAALSRDRRLRRTLLVVDQLEEAVTLATAEERDRFFESLRHALARDSRLWILATIRVEFLGELLATGHADLLRGPVMVGAMSREQLVRAIEQPGALAGMAFAPGLADAMVDDAASTDALPLLAYLLEEMYLEVGPGGAATESLYHRLGGVPGALARQADNSVAELRETGQDTDQVLRVLLKFVAVEGQEVSGRPVALAELTDRELHVVDAFVDARLLVTTTAQGARGAEEGQARVAHEALFRQWPPLRMEVEARIERLRQRAELERWAADWQRADRSADYLLSGQRLSLAERWLTDLEQEGLAGHAIRMLVSASRQNDEAFLQRVAATVAHHVLDHAEQQPESSLLLALAAYEECARSPLTQRALMAALAASHQRVRAVGHTDAVRSVAWSPDGQRIVSGSRDGTARILDAASGRTLTVIDGCRSMVESVCWSPDSTRVATASRDLTVRIWDAGDGSLVRSLSGLSDIGRGVAWSPCGRWIAATSRDTVVRVWNSSDGELYRELRGHRDDVWGVGWSPDSTRLASASHDRSAIIWDLTAGRPERTVLGHTDFVEGVAWSPDGTCLATSSGDQTIRLTDTATGSLRLLIRTHGDYVWSVAWSPDGKWLASSSSDRTAQVCSTRDAGPIAVLRGHEETVWSVGWDPSGSRLVTGSADATVQVWDLRQRGAEELLVAGHQHPLTTAAWSPDGRPLIVTAAGDGSVRSWDAESGEARGLLTQHEAQIWSVAWSPDGARLATASSDQTVRITGSSNADTMPRVLEHPSVVEAVAWSPEGERIASAGRDCILRIWDADTGAERQVFKGHQDWIGDVAWSASGRLIATASDDRTCRIWDVAADEQLVVLRGHTGYVDGVCWSPDEKRVATASGDWTIAVWEVSSGRRLATLRGHGGRVRAVAWSPDGTLIASVSDDRTVRLWSAETYEESSVAGVHAGKVMSVEWSGDGTRLLTASADGTARVWPTRVDSSRLRTRARHRVFRTLTREERQLHMLPPAP
ncbi:WD40 repeat domain-containing protein [Streptomyces sp. YIM 98790]|uniref:WD40 repeat domain-containing protein n=1 Tax=Streptomyces sp. YIM 98790 TaxID=2689077 RepID=UPI001FB68B60|nr:WD40 repeat domain-containing protein [Streptomyces sp. YIM 98790]